MKSQKYILLIFMAFPFLPLHAQDGVFSFQANTGIATPLLDNGVGLHLGINPSMEITSHFSAEGQLSYLYTWIFDSFLSGEEGKAQSINALIGGRLYLNATDRPTRIYLNLLAGGNYFLEEKDGQTSDPSFRVGLTGGACVQIRRLILGLSVEAPEYLILKIGYRW